MAPETYYLVTTANEKTWYFDKPMYFLGEWCRRYDRKEIWSQLNIQLPNQSCCSATQKDQLITQTQEQEEKLLTLLTLELNVIHGKNHSSRYWAILLGHWLRSYVSVITFRYQQLNQACERNKFSETRVFDVPCASLAHADILQFQWGCSDDIWNNVVYGAILAYLRKSDMRIEKIPLDISAPSNNGHSKLSNQKKISLWQFLKYSAQKITSKCLRDTDAFIVSSYLPILEEIKLHLSLRQAPQFWQMQEFYIAKPDIDLRQKLTDKIILTHGDFGLESCLYGLLFQMIPVCYLESYVSIQTQLQHVMWPKNPKFIYTANNFYADEVFKQWVAGKVEQGTPYFVGQHGNNYAVSKYVVNGCDEVTSDKFYTWGWSNKLNTKYKPAFIFKTCNKHLIRKNPQDLLLIQLSLPHQSLPWDVYPEHAKYQQEQFVFAKQLNANVSESLVVKMHGDVDKDFWCQKLRWLDRFQGLRIMDSSCRFLDALKNARLVVFSYDSTGILEALSLNIPMIAFWQDGLSHMIDEAKPFYQKLFDVGLIHYSPEDAAAKVNQVWDNVDAWWYSSDIQQVRVLFCQQYAKTVEKPIRFLRRMLLEGVRETLEEKELAKCS